MMESPFKIDYFDPNSWNPNQSLRQNHLNCVWIILKIKIDQKEIEMIEKVEIYGLFKNLLINHFESNFN